MHALEAAGGSFLFDEERRVVFAGGIIHGVSQVSCLPSDPFVGVSILMDYYAWQSGLFTTLSVRATFLCLGNELRFLQMLFNLCVAARSAGAVIPVMEVFDFPAHMLTPIFSGYRYYFICGCLAIRGLFQSPINQPVQSACVSRLSFHPS